MRCIHVLLATAVLAAAPSPPASATGRAPQSSTAPQAADARTPLEQALDALSFREIGPAIMGGRVAGLAPLESNPATVYVGLASGGVWLTENNGMSWTPLFDDQPCASIGAVAVFQPNPNVVWAGTGEPQNRQSSPYGCGVFRSTDGGRTWADAGLRDTRHVSRIAVHPTDPEVAYVAAVGHLFGPNEERGVFRTTDGGASWEKVLYVDENTGAVDLVMDPSDPRTLFAAMYQRRRTAFGFSASGAGSGLYRTTDGGDHWTRLEEGLPEGDLGRIGIDVYRRDGNVVYALVESRGAGRGLYKSTDRGDSWRKVSSRNPRPMYFSMVRIDPNNPERIYLGGVRLSASDDGGRTWWEGDAADGIHVDHHALWVDPRNSDYVLLGNDGGVATSVDGARTWRHHNNFAAGQFYEIGVDMSDPYRVCGGLQDNSSWCAPNETVTGYGLRNRDWRDVWGGDGFYNQFDPNDPNILYTESQGGNSGRVNLATGEVLSMRPAAPPSPDSGDENGEERSYRYNWNAPIVVSMHNSSTVYVGNNHLMRSRDRGMSWEEASPDLTKALDRDSLPIMGALVTDSTLSRHDGIATYGNITTIDESPLSPQVLYVGTDDGNVQVTQDGGATWTNVAGNVPGLPERSYVSRLEASAHAEGRVYAAFDRHWDDDYGAYVYASEDFGASWRRLSEGLPEWSVNVVREHPRSEDLLFLGNEAGVFASLDRGASWRRMGGLPTVPVDDLVVHPRDNDLVVGTHGRSIWILDDLAPLEHMAGGAVFDQQAYLFPVPRATQWFRMGGWPFRGDVYEAENPPDGAVARYWLAEGMDSATLSVMTPGGQAVRSLDAPADAGMNQVVWDLREDAPVDVPSEDGSGGGGAGGGRFGGSTAGPLVLPGAYVVRLEAGDQVAEQEVVVRMDPRTDPNVSALRARQTTAREVATLNATVVLAVRALNRASRHLDEAGALLDEGAALPGGDEVRDSLKAELAELTAAADSLREDLQEARPGRAAAGIERNAGPPSASQLAAIDRAWERVPPLVEEANAYVAERVSAFWDRMARAGVRPSLGDPVKVPKRALPAETTLDRSSLRVPVGPGRLGFQGRRRVRGPARRSEWSVWSGSLEHPLRPVVADSALSKGRMLASLSGIALLAQLPMWGVVLYRELDGDRRESYRVPITLAAAGSAAAVAWAAQRMGAKLSTALVGSTLGAGAALGLASTIDNHSELGAVLFTPLASSVVHGLLTALLAVR